MTLGKSMTEPQDVPLSTSGEKPYYLTPYYDKQLHRQSRPDPFERISLLELRSGDVLVIIAPAGYTTMQRVDLEEYVGSCLNASSHADLPIIILPYGTTLKAIRKITEQPNASTEP